MEKREDLKHYLRNSDSETTIIKFGATWCNPCQKIKPVIKSLNDQCKKMNKTYNFIDLDVDECPDIYSFLKQKKMVRGIPVLFCYKKSQYADDTFYVPCDSITGASIPDIVNFYNRNIS